MILYLEPYNAGQGGADGSSCLQLQLHDIICEFVIHSVMSQSPEKLKRSENSN